MNQKSDTSNSSEGLMTFGEHLEVFRKMLFRIIAVVLVLGTAIFCFKDTTFGLLFAPSSSDFVTYRVIEHWANAFGLNFHFDAYHVQLINTELSSQFMTHVTTSAYLALLFASPFVVYELYQFIAPALYQNEKRYSACVAVVILVLFLLGLLMSYFILFPFALRFLGTYQVSAVVANQIDLSSYISTFITLTLWMGLVFQIPVLSFFLAKLGVLTANFMKRYRRHAIVLLAVVSAVITPPDLFTCCLVLVPMYGLYEISILIVAMVGKDKSPYGNGLR